MEESISASGTMKERVMPMLREQDGGAESARVAPPSPSCRPKRTRVSINMMLAYTFILCCTLVIPTRAAYVSFENCLGLDVINSDRLQFRPLNVTAFFNSTAPSHNLNVTIYGNVTGLLTEQPYPPPDSPSWSNPNDTLGKIVDLSTSNNRYTTLFTRYNVLTYTPYDNASRFCLSTIHEQCPLGPVFYVSKYDLLELPAFTVSHDFGSSYGFTTISATLRVTSGDADDLDLACISANITPDIGGTVSSLITFLTVVILILVGLATACAAIFSPWGSSDIFRWTSNYGRDADLLRLVTPGFADCLQYIQFVFLTGALTLSYPGYYQPVVSHVGWSSLMFNTSIVSHGNGTDSLVDGMYVVTGTYGLQKMSELIGMSAEKDIWPGMAVWLLVILAAAIVLIQVAFFLRWGYRHLTNIQQEDLRAKNLPFTTGNMIRIIFNYLLLPIVALSMFQLVVSPDSPVYDPVLAAILILALIGFAGWLLYLVARTRPRSYLFDDLPTVLLYGPLYNTYSDDAATFSLIPVMLTIIRGIAIGAVQPSGIAQLVLLAICEVIFILTLHAFRPFHSPTSMNAYHTFFAVVRLLATILMVTFVPSLGISEATKGWIGYVILLLHAVVLVFGFFLNAVQTFIEVFARLAGAGGEEGVAARGGLVKVFGMRQLSRRMPRRAGITRDSGVSQVGILSAYENRKSFQLNGGRVRSTSGSSNALLARRLPNDDLTGLPPVVAHARTGSTSAPYTPTTPGTQSMLSYPFNDPNAETPARGGILGIKTVEAADPYYRPPRARRSTAEAYSPAGRTRGSWASGDWTSGAAPLQSTDQRDFPDPMEGPSMSRRGTPVPAYLSSQNLSDANMNDPRHSKTDYAVREVDFYYGVRGPALSNLPTRRLGTGPADPTGPVASATGWLKSWFGGKTKEKGKGFEVVRSSRAPPPMMKRAISTAGDNTNDEPYRDDPDEARAERSRALEPSDDGDAPGLTTSGVLSHRTSREGPPSPIEDDDSSHDEDSDVSEDDEAFEGNRISRISDLPPSLPDIDSVGGIELPSRIASKASSKPSRKSLRSRPPTFPRKSSKRKSLTNPPILDLPAEPSNRLSVVPSSPPLQAAEAVNREVPATAHPELIQMDTSRLPFDSESSSAGGNRLSGGGVSIQSSTLDSLGSGTQPHNQGIPRRSLSARSMLAPDVSNDRPRSMGYVAQHLTSDNIHTVAADSESHLGSTAEVIDDPLRRSASTGRKDSNNQ